MDTAVHDVLRRLNLTLNDKFCTEMETDREYNCVSDGIVTSF